MNQGLFGGPSGKREAPGDQRRMILAVAISAVILIGWSYLFPQAPVAPKPPADPASVAASAVASSPGSDAATPATPTEAVYPAQVLASLRAPKQQGVRIGNVDGQIEGWELEEDQYRLRDDKGEPAGAYPMVGTLDAKRQHGLFLPPRLDLSIGGKPARGEYRTVEVAAAGNSTLVRWNDPDSGAEVSRRYTLSPDDYSVDVEITVKNSGSAPLPYGLTAVLRGAQDDDEASGSMFSPPIYLFGAVCQHAKDFERVPVSDVISNLADPDEPTHFTEGVTWAGIDNRYFMSAALPGDGDARGCELLAGAEAAGVSPSSVPAKFSLLTVRLALSDGQVEPGAQVTRKLRFFGGPKKLDVLNAQTPSASAAIDFGFFSPICVPMLWLMRAFDGVFGNWGVAIILLTLMVKLLTLPLTHKQYKSMAGMKLVQPKLKALQVKYKDDKARLQTEMMALYRENKVNPMAGCFPMLLMMPIYFSLYRTIYSAVDLYQADFVFWIKDLSQQDPYYISPLLLGVLMFIQTKLSPTTGDAMQAKVMMYVMPIMFTGMMLFLPSGLVLYIFVNTLLGILQQVFIFKRVAAPVAA
jgi:YidC/Oxa1 family membrane protein insertase